MNLPIALTLLRIFLVPLLVVVLLVLAMVVPLPSFIPQRPTSPVPDEISLLKLSRRISCLRRIRSDPSPSVAIGLPRAKPALPPA